MVSRFEERIMSLGAQRERWKKILKFFLKVGTLNNLKATPALTFLENSLAIIENSRVDDGERLKVDENTKIDHRYEPVKVSGIVRSKNLIFNNIPLHNMWDAISFVYTVCVEKVSTRVQAEAHSFQFRMIVQALRAGGLKESTYLPQFWFNHNRSRLGFFVYYRVRYYLCWCGR